MIEEWRPIASAPLGESLWCRDAGNGCYWAAGVIAGGGSISWATFGGAARQPTEWTKTPPATAFIQADAEYEAMRQRDRRSKRVRSL